MNDATFERRITAGVTVIMVRGELNVAASPSLRDLLSEAASSAGPRVVVDLAECDFIDSTGLGVLVGGLKKLKAVAGVMHICAPNDRLQKILRITGLAKLFAFYDSLEEAVSAAQP